MSDLRGRAATVEVDLAGVTFADLSGDRVLLDAQGDAHLHGGRLQRMLPD